MKRNNWIQGIIEINISFIIVIIFLTSLSSCTKTRCEYKDVEWTYFDKDDPKQGRWAGSLYSYMIHVENDSILIQSKSNNICTILNEKGLKIGTCTYKDYIENTSLEQIEGTLNLWEDKVMLIDTSLISNFKLISYPIERTSLLSKRLPKRERRIEYILKGKKYTIKLPVNSSTRAVFDICQYNATKFVFSIRDKIDEISNETQHYVVMIDMENLSRHQFLGIKF